MVSMALKRVKDGSGVLARTPFCFWGLKFDAENAERKNAQGEDLPGAL